MNKNLALKAPAFVLKSAAAHLKMEPLINQKCYRVYLTIVQNQFID